MSEIKAGDMVMVVRPTKCSCGEETDLGHIYVALEIEPLAAAECTHCGALSYDIILVWENKSFGGFATYQLKKLDPLNEKDEERICELTI